MNVTTWAQALPLIFLALMGIAMLVYVISDGYDLGIGMLIHRAHGTQRSAMIDSIGPYWDANETWIVLGVGILLMAFPQAHSLVLTQLYLPVTFMLIGLVLRGVAFDFRYKAKDHHRTTWEWVFFAGSLGASLAQGWMLGRFVTGFESSPAALVFSAAIMVALPLTYVMMGACWLLRKAEGELQQRALRWARLAWLPMVVGFALISLATPWVSATVRSRWFELPQIIALSAIPLVTTIALIALRLLLGSRAVLATKLDWVPFALMILVFVLSFLGLAYSLYPYVVIDRLTVWQAAASTASLQFSLFGVCLAFPAIVGYTVIIYRVFRGKSTGISYA